MENIILTIGERKIPLRFRMDQFIEIEEEIGNLSEVKELIMKGRNRLRNLVGVIRIMGNGGLKAAGEKPDLTDEWLREKMEPHELMVYQLAVIACMTKAGESEAVKEENENKERDLVLEELEAKKGPVNSHTGG